MLLRIVTLDVVERPDQACEIRVFLRAQDGSGWCLDLHGFHPHMHVDIPESVDADDFVDWLRESARVSYIDHEIVDRQSLYGYQGEDTKPLLRLAFDNDIDRKRVRRLWFPYSEGKKPVRTNDIPTIKYHDEALHSYESGVPAILQFIHASKLKPSGIVELDPKQLSRRIRPPKALRPKHYKASWRVLHPTAEVEACSIPLLVDSYDIEASSSHGDFPMAIKNYALTSREFLQKAKTCKRDEWDIRGWLEAALGVGAAVPGISLLELKSGSKEPAAIAAAIDEVLRAACPDISKSRELVEFYNYAEDHYEGGGEGQYADDTFTASPSYEGGNGDNGEEWDEHETAAAASAPAPKRKRKPVTNVPGPLGVLSANFATHKDQHAALTKMLTDCLPQQKGDRVTYIGIVAGTTDATMPRREICFCVPKVTPKNARCELVQCSSEADLLLKYAQWWRERMPDLVIGYNIFGFDYPFMADRARELGIERDFLSMTPDTSVVCANKAKGESGWKIHETTIQLASGPHCLRQIRVPGTVNIDLLNQFRKDFRLESYSLNSVSAYLLGGKVKMVEKGKRGTHVVTVSDPQGVVEGGMIALIAGHEEPERRVVRRVEENRVTVGGPEKDWSAWGFAKDDITPADIFRLSSSGVPEEATLVANYCKQDCALVYGLFDKVDTYTALTEMSNISLVPLEFLILRGQGIKLTSLLVDACNHDNRQVEDIGKDHPDEPYEGAVVIDPKQGIYRDPVTCLDYSSLYPSADISDNVSHETLKWKIQRDMDGNVVKRMGDFDSPLAPGHHIIRRTIPTYRRISVPKKNGGFKKIKQRSGTREIAIVQYPLGVHAMMPRVLKGLLSQRKATRKRGKHKRVTSTANVSYEGAVVEDEKGNLVPNAQGEIEIKQDNGEVGRIAADEVANVGWRFSDFIRNVLDKRQLTYKVTANSLYGGTGAVTSQFYEPDVAALITAIGRAMLRFAKALMERVYKERRVVVDDEPYIVTATCVYGDTDSVFISWVIVVAAGHSTLQEGTELHGKEALPIAIGVSQQAEHLASSCLRAPHTLEYEKTFLNWLLLTRKRYAGDLYEKATDKPKLKTMGVISRRRDNAKIARDNFLVVLDNILHQSVPRAFTDCMSVFRDVQKGKVAHEDLIISKSLRAHYAQPERIAHKMLADRIAERDPGNAPKPGDRVPYVFIRVADEKLSQKDRIELPEVAGDNIDYRYYVEHQMVKPVAQMFALAMDELPGARKRCKAAVFREGASLLVRTNAVIKMMMGMLAPTGQRSIGDFFG